jgi:Tfp pilus assembly protein PilV
MIEHAPPSTTRTGHPRRPPLGAQAGFTLIEVVVSALIVIILSAGLSQALIAGTHFSAAQQHRSQGQEIAEQDQERLRGLSAKQLSDLATPQSYSVALGGMTYTVSSSATLLSTSGSASCTTAGTSAVAYYHTVSQVSWHDVNGTQSLSADSDITPPISGALLTPVVDQTNAPLPGVTVSAVGQSPGGDQESGITDSGGCVIFTGLAADTYNLTFTDTGYVDVNGNSPVTDTATVSDAGTSRPTNSTEMMGQAGSLTAGFSTVAYPSDTSTTPATLTNQSATDLGYYGAGATTSMSAAKATTSTSTTGSTSLTARNLFPFAYTNPTNYNNNYSVWAGACRQEEPPTADLTTASITPGGALSATVLEPALNLQVTYGGTRVAPSDVKLTFTSTSGTTCTDTWTEAVRGSAATSTNGVLASPGVPFASTATTGSTASASGLTGTISACADYLQGSHYYEATKPGITTTNFSAPTAATVAITSSSTQGTC